MIRHKIACLPEEPLRNACVADMSVAENMALRSFDQPPSSPDGIRLRRAPMRDVARKLIEAYRVKTPGPDAPIKGLSGGNVQRAVLARELSSEGDLLIVANPCFGLDFAAVAEIRARIVAGAQPRRRRAAGQRGSRRDPAALRPHRRDVRRQAGAADARRVGRCRRHRPRHGRAPMKTIAAQPFDFTFDPAHLALIVIDMQRDFIEPGGFGATLGNDVNLLKKIVPTVAGCSTSSAAPGCRSSTRANATSPTCRIARRPSARAASLPCGSAIPARWAAS